MTWLIGLLLHVNNNLLRDKESRVIATGHHLLTSPRPNQNEWLWMTPLASVGQIHRQVCYLQHECVKGLELNQVTILTSQPAAGHSLSFITTICYYMTLG